MKLSSLCINAMADELTKIAISMGPVGGAMGSLASKGTMGKAIGTMGKGVGSPAQSLFSATRWGKNTPPRIAMNPPIPQIGGPKMPKITQTSPNPVPGFRSSASMPRNTSPTAP